MNEKMKTLFFELKKEQQANSELDMLLNAFLRGELK